MSDDTSCCREPKRVFQGKAYIPDDHIQLISKYFQGANLNLNFIVDEEEDCERVKKRRRSCSKSRRRHRKKSRRRCKKCKCCKCKNNRCEEPKGSCCGPPKRRNCQNPCSGVANTCCCPPQKQSCCEPDPCAPKCPPKNRNCSEPTDACAEPTCCCPTKFPPVKTQCCCEKPEPEKLCCCCGRPCVEGKDKNQAGQSKDKTKSKGAEDGNHKHTRCCCKCSDSKGKEIGELRLEGSGPKPDKKKTGASAKQTAPTKSLKSSDSSQSITSKASDTTNVKQVYVAKNVSSLERDEVYGRYWYHRPPLENTITHCDDDNPPTLDDQFHEDADRPNLPETLANRQAAGRCMACKEPMCLLCKMNICECDCEKPNFVICNPCKHRLTPRPPKKCPPKKPKPIPPNNSSGCDEAMMLLPLLASMQASMQENSNIHQCNYC